MADVILQTNITEHEAKRGKVRGIEIPEGIQAYEHLTGEKFQP